MVSPKINFLVDVILAILLIIVLAARSRTHINFGVVFAIAVGIHVLLHINWIFCMVKSFFISK